MFLANASFVVPYLKINQTVYLNTNKIITILQYIEKSGIFNT